MTDDFLRAAAITPSVAVADVDYNKKSVILAAQEAGSKGVRLAVFPELVLTGYTCQDLFLQETLISAALAALREVIEATKELEMLIVLGLPFELDCKLLNVAAFICKGRLLGLVPKTYLPNYNEFYEARHFVSGQDIHTEVLFTDASGEAYMVPVDTELLFSCMDMPELIVAGELCEDVWTPAPPSVRHALSGATVIVNCSASDEATGKAAYRRSLISGQSARLVCAYIYANAGEGESTQDLVFGGHDIIAENGTVLCESELFKTGMIAADIDLGRLVSERRRMTTFHVASNHRRVPFSLRLERHDRLLRSIPKRPFVPEGSTDRDMRCEEIINIQANGLKKRLKHTGSRCAVIGISGGLDSTLALLITAKAFDLLGIPRSSIISVTMPCFGTTDRTYNNACLLTKKLSATLIEVDIRESVLRHFKDIGHDESVKDVTYENCQARERTQVLMDIANKKGGMVIGTGDLSELALGWATYNGDHMSMYGVNSSVPKTLVRHLVRFFADKSEDEDLKAVLYDILDTPVSPELLPPDSDGKIAQKTEDLVGPYELHDFFLYYLLRFGYHPKKIYRLACQAFTGEFEPEFILKWLKVFIRRFFAQQFKRSCLPDGPRVGSASISPRGDLRMPSDACAHIWLSELEELT